MKFMYGSLCCGKLSDKNIGDEGVVKYWITCESYSSYIEVLVINEVNGGMDYVKFK